MPTDIISLTEFKNDASGWIERLQNQPPVVLTQNGRGKAVVQSYESYKQQRYAVAVLQRVIQGQADALAGRTVPQEQVLAKLEAAIAKQAAKRQAAVETKQPGAKSAAARKGKGTATGRRRA